jgi:glycosyltransferase involved in cell wall biosynthesis
VSDQPLAVLLLPRPLEAFILRDQAEDLLKAPGALAVEPARVPYGAIGRLPAALGFGLGRRQARRLLRALPGKPAAVVIFHPFQVPLAFGLLELVPAAELWYGRWDRYEVAIDASPAMRARLAVLHEQAAARSALTFVVSGRLAELEREAGREAQLVGLAADSFPAPDPGAAVIAVSLGHLGWRTDWGLLRAVAERMPELVLLLVGEWHDDECAKDPDYAWCRSAANLVWLGRRSDEEAARLILCADVGVLPFRVEPFNDAALPYRILKYARLGRRTVSPPLAGVRTWEHAVRTADGADEFVAALRAHAGARTTPDAALRAWALQQTAERVNAPLWDRLRELGMARRREEGVPS